MPKQLLKHTKPYINPHLSSADFLCPFPPNPITALLSHNPKKNVMENLKLTLTVGFKQAVKLNPIDANGNPAALPAGVVPSWSGAVADVAEDGLSAFVLSSNAGEEITNTVTATLADGTVISDTITVTTVAAVVTAPAVASLYPIADGEPVAL